MHTPSTSAAGPADPAAHLPLEQAALRAWPALETVEEDGWVLRCSHGYTRRSNSVTVLAEGPAHRLDARVLACEEAFRARGLPPLFRLVSFAEAAALDVLLAGRGYRRQDETQVMTRPLPRDGPAPAELEALELEAWLPLYERFAGRDAAQRTLHRALLQAIPGRRLLASLGAGGQAAAVGLAVVDGASGPWAGFFDVATDPARRRQGLGRRLMTAMMGWAAGAGAEAAHLQVVAANAPAVRLYEGLGFAEAYRYWYRAGGPPR